MDTSLRDPAGTPRGHRAGRRRRLWTGGLAAATITAGLVAPWLTPAGTSSAAQPAAGPAAEQVAQGAAEEAEDTRRAPAATPAPVPAPAATPPAVTSPAVAPSAAGSSDNPLAGMTFHGPNTGAARAAAQPGRTPAATAALAALARVPTATWLGAWSGDVTAAVRREVAAARTAGAVPVLVTYDVPGRDCGGYSAGGVDSPAAYLEWVRAVAAGIGTAQAVVVVEPDALAQLCGDPAERTALLRSAVGLLEANPGTVTYLDAGNPTWIDAATMAERLRAAGVTAADGFALNVSNFETTADNVTYGQRLSALLDGAHFVVDTSRNGNGPGSDWCNPAGREIGERPTTQTGHAGVDAFLWVKRVGESDGTCNGGPPAGTFWDSYAVGLVDGA